MHLVIFKNECRNIWETLSNLLKSSHFNFLCAMLNFYANVKLAACAVIKSMIRLQFCVSFQQKPNLNWYKTVFRWKSENKMLYQHPTIAKNTKNIPKTKTGKKRVRHSPKTVFESKLGFVADKKFCSSSSLQGLFHIKVQSS